MLTIAIITLLIASAVNLTLLIPGGFVENREFRSYPVWVIAGFNVFLTVLGFGSLVLAYLLFQSGTGFGWAALIGLGYIVVYVIDLAEWFPVSTTPMSARLKSLERVGTVLGVALSALSLIALSVQDNALSQGEITMPGWICGLLGLATLGIVVFATRKALKR